MRLISEHFKRDGSPKRAYPDRALAVAAVGKSREHVYRCKFCGAWHRAKDRAARASTFAPKQRSSAPSGDAPASTAKNQEARRG